MMLKIAHQLPQDVQSIVNCCIPIPPLVHTNIETIHKIILQAIENVPVVPEDDDEVAGKCDPPVVKKKNNDPDRVWAIEMVNNLFVMQLTLRPELRLLPEAAPLLKWEKMNSVR